MKWTTLIVLAGLGVTACSTTAPTPEPASLADDGGAPAPVTGMDWFLTEDAVETTLAYGRANSDDLRLALTCVPGSGRLGLLQPAASGATNIHLESGGDSERFPAVVEPAGVHDGDLLTAEATTGVPVFLRFRALGWLAAWEGQQRQLMVAHPPSEPSVERFFAVCG